jgi:anti-sigma factor RsiW
MAHLTPDTLQALAEDELPSEARLDAEAHLTACAECAGELDVYRTIFASLADLPRFAPSRGFTDAVMSKVQIVPAPALPVRVIQRLLPSTRKGWTILVGVSSAPVLAYVALLAWLFSNPLVSAEGLGAFAFEWSRTQLGALATWAADGLVGLGVVQMGQALAASLLTVPTDLVVTLAVVLAIATPLSIWTLYRSLRTPLGGIAHAAR